MWPQVMATAREAAVLNSPGQKDSLREPKEMWKAVSQSLSNKKFFDNLFWQTSYLWA